MTANNGLYGRGLVGWRRDVLHDSSSRILVIDADWGPVAAAWRGEGEE